MPILIRDTLFWAWDYVQHVVVMFYWFWVPGVLVLGFLSTRYRPVFEALTLKQRQGVAAFWAAIGWGMTSAAGRRSGLEVAQSLWQQGLPNHLVLAYLVASQSLVLYSLLLFTVLIGLEFGLGVLFGGLAMIGLLRLLAPGRTRGSRLRPDLPAEVMGSPPETWKDLLCSARGWGLVARDVGWYLRNVGVSLLGGLVLGALVLTIDTRGHWFFPKWMGDETVGAALAGSFLAPFLSVLLFLAPGGNLIVVSSIWKTWTLAYSGVISLVLMSLLHPLTVQTLLRQYDSAHGWRLVLTIYLSAALSGLVVAGVFDLVGLQVTHVPWFRDLVDKLMMMFPFTMLGTGGMGSMGK